MLNSRYALAVGLTLVSCVMSTRSLAQEPSALEEEFRKQLAERDAIIIGLQHSVAELRERVTALEARLLAGSVDDTSMPRPVATTTMEPIDSRENAPDHSDSSRLIVDEVAAERALERTLVQAGALLLPQGAIELSPYYSVGVSDFQFPTSLDTDAGTEFGLASIERTSHSLGLTARIGLPFDGQLELSLPYVSVTEESRVSDLSGPIRFSSDTGRGRGDILVGISKTLLRESRFVPDIVGRLTWNTGEGTPSDDGVYLGGGFPSLSGTLSLVKRKDPLALFLSAGYQDFDKRGDTAPGNAVNFSLGTGLAVSPESSLFGAINHRSISETEVDGESIAGTDLDITALTIGFSTILRRGTLLNLYSNFGMSDDAADFAVGFSEPIRLR